MANDVTRPEFDALESRVNVHDVQLAVQNVNHATLQKSVDAVVGELVKTRWTLIGGAVSVAVSCVGLVIGLK